MATQCFPRRALFHSLHKVGSTNLINSISVFLFSLVFALLPSRLISSSPVALSAFSVPVLPATFPSLAGVPVQSPSPGATPSLAAFSHQCLQDILSHLSLLPSVLFNSFPRVAAVSVGSRHYVPTHTALVTEGWLPIQSLPIPPPSTPREGPGSQHRTQGMQGLDCDVERSPAEGFRASLGAGLCHTGRSPVLLSLGRFKSPGGLS